MFLVVYSITMFINNWRRNYTDIYQPTFIYSTEEEKDESEQNLAQSKWRLNFNFNFNFN